MRYVPHYFKVSARSTVCQDCRHGCRAAWLVGRLHCHLTTTTTTTTTSTTAATATTIPSATIFSHHGLMLNPFACVQYIPADRRCSLPHLISALFVRQPFEPHRAATTNMASTRYAVTFELAELI